jgi:asparagine synthase (glutamine-hydrolysing)
MLGLREAPANASVIERMTASLRHRGPDGAGVYIAGPVGFGFRRLSILDLSPAADQPMSSDDGQVTLVFNGEIFNYIELRHELEALGYKFRSTGDTEVLLHAYRQWGRECVHRFNGMWAFVIYDRQRACLFGSRDRFGIKPLYLYRAADSFLFASEIKAILCSGLYQPSPNWQVIASFLLQDRLDESAESFYQGIEQILPGTAFELKLDGQLQKWRYWSLSELPAQRVQDPALQFAELFEDSVRLRMRSDVRLGVSLSGGLDSTSIICAMARHWDNPAMQLHAFTYHAVEFDESAYVADTIDMTRACLTKLESRPIHIWESLDRFLTFHDEPVHSINALVGFELMGLAASSGVKVILSGQGADEALAGYHSYFRDYWFTLLKNGAVAEAWEEIGKFSSHHGGSQSRQFLKVARHLLQVRLRGANAYRRVARWRKHRAVQRDAWFNPAISQHLTIAEDDDIDWTLAGVQKRSVESAPLPIYLRVEDRNSMAHSMEARLPFLDHRLVALALNLPTQWKMRGPLNKFALREAMRERIPESVRKRVDKMGFPVPSKNWFSGPLYELTQDLLASREMRERGIYNLDKMRRDLELHRQGKINVGDKLFGVVQFEMWSRLQGNLVRASVNAGLGLVRP